MEKLALWLAQTILEFLFKKAMTAAAESKAQAEKEKERGETDAINVKKYEEAMTRAEEISAATDLLNGVRGNRG